MSLTDTFWVKEYIEDICWNDVSPYINEFNDVISHYSFDGRLCSKEVGGFYG